MIKLVLAGFGGQGVLSLGQMLAQSGLNAGKEVSYLPAYGPEMRGGTANCSVVISDQKIASPLCETPDVLVAMNSPSLAKFSSKVKPGGVIIQNTSLICERVGRTDIKVYCINANDIAQSVGSAKAANMVMAGAIAAVSNAAEQEGMFKCIEDKFGAKPSLVQINKDAYFAGYNAVKNA